MFNWFLKSSKSRLKAQSAGARRRLPAAGGAAAGRLALLPVRRDERPSAPLPEWARQLHPQAQRVLATLPASVRLARSCRQYPQAVETILANWSHPRDFRRVLDSMVIDSRGGRQGFPFDVVCEFGELREYYDTYVHPVSTNAWASADIR